METHVVVTSYVRAPGRDPLMHAYGPYTQNKARRVKTDIIGVKSALKPGESLHVSVCKLWKEEGE